MRFAKTVFTGAGLWGLVVLAPQYFTFDFRALHLQGRVRVGQRAAAGPDLVLAIISIVSFFKVDDDGRRSHPG